MMFWMLSIPVSVALLVAAAAAKPGNPAMAYAHMAIAAITAIAFAIVAVRATRAVVAGGGSRAAISARSAWSMGYVWLWGTLGLLATYLTGVAYWHEWLHFFLAFAVAGGAALFFANLLQRDADAGKSDEAIVKLSRYLAYAQFFGMLAVMIGLLVDGKMTRFLVPRHGDWAANNIFFFGALALALISAYALKVSSGEAEKSEA